ncbi:MAG TPA: hypothetical protein PKA41_10025 [Verrucomicrobiota bacterium]|nr:hypothetical protein [Verrucomicrobiota bacterium]
MVELLYQFIFGFRKRSHVTREHLHAYCLGLDIVGYSKHTTDVQRRMVTQVQEVIEKSPAVKSVSRSNLVFLPTGDGMIICLLGGEDTPLIILQLAEHLQCVLRKRNKEAGQQDEEIILRMGIHSGTGSSYIDINGNINIAGTVANMTQRVTAFGEDWHIIASKNAFDDIATLEKKCQKLFHRIGFGEAKHKVLIEVYNVYCLDKEPFGNPETPIGIQDAGQGAPTHTDKNAQTGVS